MKPTNIVWEQDDYGEFYLVFTWKGRSIRLPSQMKPQFLESGHVFLGSDHADLVPPVKYTNPDWGVIRPKLIPGLVYDPDLVRVYREFQKAVDDGSILSRLGGSRSP